MCKSSLLVFVLGCIAVNINAQYPIAAIPDSLTKDARMVIRLDEKVYEIKAPGKATEHERHVYSILNETGNRYAHYNSHYSKFNSINYIDAILYDASGKVIKHVKKKDMADVSGSDDETLMTDDRYKRYNMEYGIYPYTVDFDEEDDYSGILYIDDWFPQSTSGVAVMDSRFVIIAPKDYVVRYKAFNYNAEPVITEQSDKKIYTWEIKNLPPKTEEEAAPGWAELLPYVTIAPSDFEAEGYKGDMTTWKSYGQFYYQLLQGRDVLPENIKAKVHELTDGLKEPKEKVYALYDFLQKNTRYISIQLGIGGWQPFDASFVATKRYGDCKALSNYMVALLKEAGIKGNSVIIRSGANAAPIFDDFPSDQFDHVIACVPLQKDTVWLECTNQTMSPGFLGTFTEGRKGLMVDETGGYLVSTPRYTATDNTVSRKVHAIIDGDGNLDADISTRYTGIREELPHSLMNDATKEQRDEYLNSVLNLPTYNVDKSNYTEQKGKIPVVNENLHVTSQSYASVSGKRLFVAPNLFNKSTERYHSDSVRKYDIVFRYAYTDVDTIDIKIPEGYTPEAIPKNITVSNKFGSYTITYNIDGNNITCIRSFERNSGRFAPSEYNSLVKFYDDMFKADRSKIVFVKKES